MHSNIRTNEMRNETERERASENASEIKIHQIFDRMRNIKQTYTHAHTSKYNKVDAFTFSQANAKNALTNKWMNFNSHPMILVLTWRMAFVEQFSLSHSFSLTFHLCTAPSAGGSSATHKHVSNMLAELYASIAHMNNSSSSSGSSSSWIVRSFSTSQCKRNVT